MSIANSTPLLIVGAFLLITLLVGLYFGREKLFTLREYAIGNKRFPTATLVATVLATTFDGAALLGPVERIYEHGLYWVGLMVLGSSTFWINSVLAVRIGPFMQNLSMAESIDKVYGTYPRLITALASMGACVAWIALQINVMECILQAYTNYAYPYALTLVATIVLITYSAMGGIRSVTFTDVLQFITFVLIIPFLAWFLFKKIDKPVADILPVLQSHPLFQVKNVLKLNLKSLAIASLLLSGFVDCVDAPFIQRMYMASSPNQARKVFLYSWVASTVIVCSIILIGIFAFVAIPNVPSHEIWKYIFASLPPIFKGMVMISFLAMAMSTADSCLNTCSVIASHDILPMVNKFSTDCQIRIAKITTVVVGFLSMGLAFKYKNLLELLYLALDFYIPIIPVPFILSVCGFRGTSRTALIGMATGGIAIFFWKKCIEPREPELGINGAFPCMVMNGLAMMAAHYLLPHSPHTGWIGPDDEFKQLQQAKVRKKIRRQKEVTPALMLLGLFLMLISVLGLIYVKNYFYLFLFQFTIALFLIAYALKQYLSLSNLEH